MKNININCPINGTGYGITSLNITKSLFKKGYNLSLFPIGNSLDVNSEEDKKIIEKILKNSETFEYSAPCLKIWHQYDLAHRVGNGHYYSFPFFEIDKITQKEKHHLNYCDYIFVASKWARKVLIDNEIKKPIYVCPLGVDLSIFNEPVKIRIKKPNYVFFHIGKWEHRKSHDILIQAFSKAFKKEDNVELRLLPHNPFLNEQENQYWHNMVHSSPLKDKIRIFDRLPTQYHIASFIDSADCGVYVSRAEGWNNEIIETMAMNKPVIVTNYSAHTEYCSTDNAYLVDINETEPANDGKWFFGNGNWAKIGSNQIDQIVDHMKYVYSNNITENPNGVITANKYTWDHTTDIITETFARNNSYYANTKAKSKRR